MPRAKKAPAAPTAIEKLVPLDNHGEPPRAGPTASDNRTGHAGDRVSVMCKVPSGLILRLYTMEDQDEQVMGGGIRRSKVAVQVGDQIIVNGPGTPHGQAPKCLIIGGYALTQNVPRDFFEKWMHDNRQSEIVKNNLIFAASNDHRATDQAKEQRAVRTGMEPLDMTPVIKPDGSKSIKDPRVPKGLPGIPKGIEPGEKE